MKMGKIEKWFMKRPHHTRRASDHAQKLLHFAQVKEKQRYLEVGCGSGAACRYIAERYHLNVTGIDVDPELIQYASKDIEDERDICFLEGDATRLPFPDENFDIVSTFGVTHHISDWLKALSEMKRVLKNGGYLIYFDLLYPKWLARIGKSLTSRYGFPSEDDLKIFIQNNNFLEVYSSSKKGLVFHQYEAVYKNA